MKKSNNADDSGYHLKKPMPPVVHVPHVEKFSDVQVVVNDSSVQEQVIFVLQSRWHYKTGGVCN